MKSIDPFHSSPLDKNARSVIKGQRPVCLWFTGLPGAGKSTLARSTERILWEAGYHTFLLDGDHLRTGLNKDLGFTIEDRLENTRRVGAVAKLFVDAGIIVLAALITPLAIQRATLRTLFSDGEFIEIFVSTPLEICESRDPKGHYAAARREEILDFTGISSPFERPERPDISLSCDDNPENSTSALFSRFAALGLFTKAESKITPQ